VLSVERERVPFCVLTRYLIMNKVTGYCHIYEFKQFEPTTEDPVTDYFFKMM
jgi:hypothetical protein